jgi:hypothetical protein
MSDVAAVEAAMREWERQAQAYQDQGRGTFVRDAHPSQHPEWTSLPGRAADPGTMGQPRGAGQ